MKKLIKGFSQYINECGCAGGGMLPEDESVDMGLDTTGTGIKDQVDGSVMEDDENEGEGGGEDSKQINIAARGEALTSLLNKIKELCDAGTSFEITITPEGEDAEPDTIIWDGDGDDYIDNLEIEGEEGESGEFSDDDEYGEGEGDDDEYESGDNDSEESDDDFENEDDEDEDEGFNESKKFSKKQAAFFGKKAKGKDAKKDEKKPADKKKVNETFKAGKTVGGVKVPAMEGPKTGGAKKVNEKTITQKNGSYPISGAASLKKAEHAFGRSKDKAKTKKHIVSSAKELGLSSTLSDKWKK